MQAFLIPVMAAGIYAWYNHIPPLIPGQKSLTFYHMSSCSHCKHMYPVIRKFGCQYKDIKIRWIEDRNNTELSVNSFPTLIFRNSDGQIIPYQGQRSYEDIKHFLDQHS